MTMFMTLTAVKPDVRMDQYKGVTYYYPRFIIEAKRRNSKGRTVYTTRFFVFDIDSDKGFDSYAIADNYAMALQPGYEAFLKNLATQYPYNFIWFMFMDKDADRFIRSGNVNGLAKQMSSVEAGLSGINNTFPLSIDELIEKSTQNSKDNKWKETTHTTEDFDSNDDRYFSNKAKYAASQAYLKINPNSMLNEDDLYIIKLSKTLDGWQATVSTDKVVDVYFEVTYDSITNMSRVDVYEKQASINIRHKLFEY